MYGTVRMVFLCFCQNPNVLKRQREENFDRHQVVVVPNYIVANFDFFIVLSTTNPWFLFAVA
jgi:hypothetical protein